MKSLRYFFVLFLISISLCQVVYPFSADVVPLNDNSYFKTVHSLFSKAKNSIYVIMYSAKWYNEYPDSFSNKLINSLIAAKKRGVNVNVILDKPYKDDKSKKESEKVKNILTKNGIKVYFDSEDITTHSKLIIVDGRYSIVGSTNWTYYALDKNNETNVLIDSEQVAKEYIKYFEELKTLCK